jgi:hypothetical protein
MIMAPWTRGAIGCACAIAGLLCTMVPAPAQSLQNVQIGALSDLSFGTIASVTSNPTVSENLCVFTSTGSYSVGASGSGSNGSFALLNGAVQMPYTVQWAASGSQATGTQLTAGQATRFTPSGLNLLCSLGGLLAGSATLLVTLPAASLSAAQAGSYSGTLTLLIAPN